MCILILHLNYLLITDSETAYQSLDALDFNLLAPEFYI
jgi:hypothetical protein